MLTFVKDEGNNLMSMVTTLHSIIDYEVIVLVTLHLKSISILQTMKRWLQV